MRASDPSRKPKRADQPKPPDPSRKLVEDSAFYREGALRLHKSSTVVDASRGIVFSRDAPQAPRAFLYKIGL